ncbi:hypothetical protein COCON_G00164940 [Conger conger]|uniref:DDE Tnp4 domain-containing protein n=1 Tax=Conger conger TaxID=82655 RepID=A0A9Q1D6R9_CONCO|nr:hypothetical protein COCON_G00164940 [Conger conger]
MPILNSRLTTISHSGLTLVLPSSQGFVCVPPRWPEFLPDRLIWRPGDCAGQFDGILLGDRGYPCLPFLMTPYPSPEAGPQTNFNLAHSRTRAGVGTTLGILKARFECLHGLRVSPERSCDIIVACTVLHNLAIMRGEGVPPGTAPEEPDEGPFPHIQDDAEGLLVRDSISKGWW